jgi:hypothetical protein
MSKGFKVYDSFTSHLILLSDQSIDDLEIDEKDLVFLIELDSSNYVIVWYKQDDRSILIKLSSQGDFLQENFDSSI